MSKKEKNIPVSIDAASENGQDFEIVKVNEREIGRIIPDGDRFIAKIDERNSIKVKTHEEGLNAVLQEFNLHNG